MSPLPWSAHNGVRLSNRLRWVASSLGPLFVACSAAPAEPEPVGLSRHELTLVSPWQEAQRVSAPIAAAGDQFGLSPVICGDLAVLGAWHTDVPTGSGMPLVDAGAAYVYERSRSTRRFEPAGRLLAPDGAAGDAFGFAVACNGDSIAVGALFADVPGPGGTALRDAGAVYLFEKRADGWQPTQKITALDAAASDAFGFALSMTRDGLLIGAPYADQPSPTPALDVGAAYVYTRGTAGWAVDSKLLARDGAASDFFGRAVALSGETALIGAMYRDVKVGDVMATDAGAAYVFAHRSGRWSQTQLLTAFDAQTRDLFGFAVALADDVAVIGAYLADLPDGPSGSPRGNAGAAYVYRRKSDVFAATDKLTAPDAARDDYFGTSVAINGRRLLVGSIYADLDLPDGTHRTNAGAVYAFAESGETFRAQSKLIASDAGDRDALGRSVALSGNTALLAAPGKLLSGLPDVGAAYFFDYTPLALGSPCSPATGVLDCQSGFCADGVCCNSACGDGSADCQGCRGAETGRSDGECAPLVRGVVCRAKNPGNSCDIDDVCDGRSLTCGARFAPTGTPCRAREFCGECGPRGSCEATRLCR